VKPRVDPHRRPCDRRRVHDPMWRRKLVLVTGKGGVGKTTLAAALARRAQAAGARVLAAEVSTDVATASPLMRMLGHPEARSTDPVRLESGLSGVRLVPSAGHRRFLQASLRVKMLVDAAMRSSALNRFLMAAPAFPEVGTLFQLVSLLRENDFDHVIVDLPATGHAIGLAALPQTVLRVVPSGLIGDAIREGLELMTDPDRGHALLVTLPEAMPVSETMELCQTLDGLGIRVQSMVLNRIPTDPFSSEERRALRAHLVEAPDRPLLGAREFSRLERARTAMDRFREEAPSAVSRVFLPDWTADSEPELVAKVEGRLQEIEA
jgi:arsenite/tail-anchored protein-transporting ATPase